jgi:hypothetical protein
MIQKNEARKKKATPFSRKAMRLKIKAGNITMRYREDKRAANLLLNFSIQIK